MNTFSILSGPYILSSFPIFNCNSFLKKGNSVTVVIDIVTSKNNASLTCPFHSLTDPVLLYRLKLRLFRYGCDEDETKHPSCSTGKNRLNQLLREVPIFEYTWCHCDLNAQIRRRCWNSVLLKKR